MNFIDKSGVLHEGYIDRMIDEELVRIGEVADVEQPADLLGGLKKAFAQWNTFVKGLDASIEILATKVKEIESEIESASQETSAEAPPETTTSQEVPEWTQQQGLSGRPMPRGAGRIRREGNEQPDLPPALEQIQAALETLVALKKSTDEKQPAFEKISDVLNKDGSSAADIANILRTTLNEAPDGGPESWAAAFEALIEKDLAGVSKLANKIKADMDSKLNTIIMIFKAMEEAHPEAPAEETAEKEQAPDVMDPNEEDKGVLISAFKEFKENFFKEKYLSEQAKLVNNLYKILKKIAIVEDKEARQVAFTQGKETEKPEEATTQTATQEPVPLEESLFGKLFKKFSSQNPQPDEEPETEEEKEEVLSIKQRSRNVRMSLQVLRDKVKKSTEMVAKVQKFIQSGRITATQTRDILVKFVKDIQEQIKRINNDLNKILKGNISQTITEDVEKEMDVWKKTVEEIRKVYKAIAEGTDIAQGGLLDMISALEKGDEVPWNDQVKVGCEKALEFMETIVKHFKLIKPFEGGKLEDATKMVDEYAEITKNLGLSFGRFNALMDRIKGSDAAIDVIKALQYTLVEYSKGLTDMFGVEGITTADAPMAKPGAPAGPGEEEAEEEPATAEDRDHEIYYRTVSRRYLGHEFFNGVSKEDQIATLRYLAHLEPILRGLRKGTRQPLQEISGWIANVGNIGKKQQADEPVTFEDMIMDNDFGEAWKGMKKSYSDLAFAEGQPLPMKRVQNVLSNEEKMKQFLDMLDELQPEEGEENILSNPIEIHKFVTTSPMLKYAVFKRKIETKYAEPPMDPVSYNALMKFLIMIHQKEEALQEAQGRVFSRPEMWLGKNLKDKAQMLKKAWLTQRRRGTEEEFNALETFYKAASAPQLKFIFQVFNAAMSHKKVKIEFDMSTARQLLNKPFAKADKETEMSDISSDIWDKYGEDIAKLVEDPNDQMLMLRLVGFMLKEALPVIKSSQEFLQESFGDILKAIVPQEEEEEVKREYRKSLGDLLKQKFKGHELLTLIDLMKEPKLTNYLINIFKQEEPKKVKKKKRNWGKSQAELAQGSWEQGGSSGGSSNLEEMYSTAGNFGHIHAKISGNKEYAGHVKRSQRQGLRNVMNGEEEEGIRELEEKLARVIAPLVQNQMRGK